MTLVLALVLSLSRNVQAQDGVLSRFTNTFDGYLKNSTAVRLNEMDEFTAIQNVLELKYSDWLSDYIGLTLVGRAVYDGVYDVEDGLNPRDEDDYRAYADLREAVLDVTLGDLDLHLGRQQVVWGKTDGFRVTDVVNPLDLRDTASTEFLDQRIPLWMANAEYYLGDFGVQALIIPDLRFHKLPDMLFPQGVQVADTQEPATTAENTELGLKFFGYAGGWDFTLNYLYSWDDAPAFKKSVDTTTGGLTISPEHQRLHIVGGTFANVLLDAVVRGEVAAKVGQYFAVDDLMVADMIVDKTLLSYALAAERDLFDITWTVQALQEAILDYDDAISTDEFQTYATLRGARSFLQETLEVTAFIIYNANDSIWTLKPAVEYAYSDSLSLKGGLDFMAGDTDDDDEASERFYAEVRYNF
jgi:hypothetical protein